MTILDIQGVSKSFGGIKALSNVSFTVDEGSIFGLMGANGAGKTTLFGVIAGQIKPNTGSVAFRKQVITGKRPDQICRIGISRTFQIVRPFAGISVLDNVIVSALYGAAANNTHAEAREAGLAALEAVGLADAASQMAGELTLSGQKRLEIARALATGAELVLLDEVMAGLTPTEIERMVETLSELRHSRNLTFMLVEHVMGALMQLSDRILALDHGVPIAIGTPTEIAENEEVLKVYFG
ncbi:ABC transporter ATP-binding protein [Mesorhizobium sp. CGMCC 1.15528]|uniref:ABC transporter ATP-binding protein n=1 Tax=Mesorhizobium zhangyense TaxID=1776730 RepID=A0A7C9REG0_9HYPH|nr:ABC transporter ATP-binding protein [Mesorhizobium zhangyense]NGN44673.1 ABC transporter ATP-binding protein [Mesorhizobium zhangyense]